MANDPAEIALGPIFLGTVFNIALYGIMVAQVYFYFTACKKDRNCLTCLVIFLFMADTVNVVLDLVYIYDMLIINFGNAERLKVIWTFAADPAMTGIISSCVQLFYAWRVKVVTNNIWAVMFIVACAIVNMLGAIGTSIAAGIVPIFTEAIRFKVIVMTWLLAAAFGDVCITVSLTYYLQRYKTGFAATDDVVNRMIRLTVQTGAITFVCATVDLIFFLADTRGTHLMFNVPLSKLYTNSLMSTLNAGGGWRLSQQSVEFTSNIDTGVTEDKSRV